MPSVKYPCFYFFYTSTIIFTKFQTITSYTIDELSPPPLRKPNRGPHATSSLWGVQMSSVNCLCPSFDPQGDPMTCCPCRGIPVILHQVSKVEHGSFPHKRFFPLQLPLNFQVFRCWVTAGSSWLVQQLWLSHRNEEVNRVNNRLADSLIRRWVIVINSALFSLAVALVSQFVTE